MTTTALAPRPEQPLDPPAQPQASDRSRRGLAGWTQKDWNRAATFAVVITALGAATDAIFATEVLKLLVGSTFLASLAAIGAVTVASACAFFAGHIIHHAERKRWGWILAGVWALIGLGLGAMRMVHSQIKVPDTEGATSGEIDRILRNAFLADIGMGVLMLVIFLATGILLIHKAKDLGDPDLRRMLKGLSDRTLLLKLWAEADSQAVQAGNLLARRTHHIHTTLEQERQNAHDGNLAIRNAAKEASLVAQAEIIADPTATLMTQIPPKETPYRPADKRHTETTSTAGTAPENTGSESNGPETAAPGEEK
ncbi:hypothetical protein DM793_04045 [Paenarthrobacter nitroguajacolicus]|uniref:hypothetical protein n=1 Tax=Paenarthrobacter nitroguajacolicus TaxID=211146 RepID=UPI0015BEE78E|nr:hypothetical protein [Paenarthrobacter nitroguajacolicus]NWL10268.1 hypothetical protein [Paenarthrobacter nitroguajacolicus]NWL10474.1 hypothetical protein [Paenarthrobacter nitroguajacolicus]